MTLQKDYIQINEKEARKLAAEAGIKTSKITKELDGSRSMSVGAFIVSHDGKGGNGCWVVSFDGVNVFTSRWGNKFRIGEAIYHAVQKSL